MYEKAKKFMLRVCLLAGALAVFGETSMAYQAEKDINVNRMIDEPLYTHSSGGKELYRGEEKEIVGLLDGREFGIIGKITSEGRIILNLPEELPMSILTPPDVPNMIASDRGKVVFMEDSNRGSRTISEGVTSGGGTLFTNPALTLWKSDEEILVEVYVSEDYESSDMGIFKKGWNYASNVDHRRVDSPEGYRWVIIDDQE